MSVLRKAVDPSARKTASAPVGAATGMPFLLVLPDMSWAIWEGLAAERNLTTWARPQHD